MEHVTAADESNKGLCISKHAARLDRSFFPSNRGASGAAAVRGADRRALKVDEARSVMAARLSHPLIHDDFKPNYKCSVSFLFTQRCVPNTTRPVLKFGFRKTRVFGTRKCAHGE